VAVNKERGWKLATVLGSVDSKGLTQLVKIRSTMYRLRLPARSSHRRHEERHEQRDGANDDEELHKGKCALGRIFLFTQVPDSFAHEFTDP
jgi:hypothetical protein